MTIEQYEIQVLWSRSEGWLTKHVAFNLAAAREALQMSKRASALIYGRYGEWRIWTSIIKEFPTNRTRVDWEVEGF